MSAHLQLVHTTQAETGTEAKLAGLKAEAVAGHRQCEASWRMTLDGAIRAGEALIEAKAMLAHGEWGPWLRSAGIAARRGQKYMQVAKKRPGAHLKASTLSGALDALAGPRPRSESPWEQWMRVVGDVTRPANGRAARAHAQPNLGRYEPIASDPKVLRQEIDNCDVRRAALVKRLAEVDGTKEG